MGLVRSRIPPQSSLFSCTPRLGRHRPGGIPSGLRQQQRAPAASVFPTALSAVRRHPSPGQSPLLPSGSEACRRWNNGRCTSGFSQCQRRHECARCHGQHQSQLPLRCGLPPFTLSLQPPLESPSTTLSFLGVVLDNLLLQAGLPEENVSALQNLLCSYSPKRVCLCHDLESLLAHLHHAAKFSLAARFCAA